MAKNLKKNELYIHSSQCYMIWPFVALWVSSKPFVLLYALKIYCPATLVRAIAFMSVRLTLHISRLAPVDVHPFGACV